MNHPHPTRKRFTSNKLFWWVACVFGAGVLACVPRLSPREQLLRGYLSQTPQTQRHELTQPRHLYGLGRLALQQNRLRLAISYLSRALKKKSRDSAQTGYFANRELGIAYFRQAREVNVRGYLRLHSASRLERQRRFFNAQLHLRQVVHFCTLALYYLRFSLKDVSKGNKRARAFVHKARALKRFRESTIEYLQRQRPPALSS